MALAVNGSGTLFKKCDRSNHRPDSNKGCASSTLQHTCDATEHCHRAWTLRFRVNAGSTASGPRSRPVREVVRFEKSSGSRSRPGTTSTRHRVRTPARAGLAATAHRERARAVHHLPTRWLASVDRAVPVGLAGEADPVAARA